MTQLVVTGDCFLGTKIYDKLADTLAFGKTVLVTDWNSDFYLSVGLLVTISTGDLVATTVTASIVYAFLDVKIDDKLARTLALENTVSFFATVGTAAIDTKRSVSFCAAALGDFLSWSIRSLISSFFSSSVVLSW